MKPSASLTATPFQQRLSNLRILARSGPLGLRESALGPLVALGLPVKVEAEEDFSFGTFALGLLEGRQWFGRDTPTAVGAGRETRQD